MDLTTMRDWIRADLHDEDSASYRWTNTVLNRHIDRTVREFSMALPRAQTATLTTSAGSRDLSIASLTNLVDIEAVEYPTGKYPPVYAPFSLWESTLTLLVDSTPSGGQAVKVYYGKLHALDASTSTLPPHLEDLVAAGGAGYAAVEWASFATNRVNVGGEAVWRHYLTWGQQRLAFFNQRLTKLSRRGSLRAQRLYGPAHSKPSQSLVVGP
ncbi:MAG: hypothetical protein FJ320_12280 [SAR202 cluster bacterium]|nr:hypothetical protein [SAR202 cluster bacterium]